MDNKYKEWDKIMFNAESGSIWRKDVEDNIDVDVEKVIQKVYHTKELQTILDDIIKTKFNFRNKSSFTLK